MNEERNGKRDVLTPKGVDKKGVKCVCVCLCTWEGCTRKYM